MAGANLESLPAPRRLYRLGKDTRREDGKIEFRTVEKERSRDKQRIQCLRQCEGLIPNEQARSLTLARRLHFGLDGKPPRTLASALFYRQERVRILGNLWEAVERYDPEDTAFVTLMPQGMLFRADELSSLDPRLLKKRLLNDLDRGEKRLLEDLGRGETKMPGFAFAGLHAEFDANRHGGVWDFHFHVIACGDKVEVFERLRDVRKYSNGRTHPLEQGRLESPRVRIQRGLSNLPDPITYALESWVPHRPTVVAPDGTLKRSERKFRIPSPYYQQWLMWMDRWRVADFILLNGMRPGKDGFMISNP
jgi:hypothetical protein